MKTCLPENASWLRQCSKSADVTQQAQAACNGKTSCSFHGSPAHAGDPCPNIVKFTVINYKCLPGNVLLALSSICVRKNFGKSNIELIICLDITKATTVQTTATSGKEDFKAYQCS